MGDFRVRQIRDGKDRGRMYKYALNDIEAFEMMLEKGLFDSGPPKIGAEQELCLVNNIGDPATTSLHFLENINDEHYTNELALFNLEINSDPEPLGGNCFSKMESELMSLLQKGYKMAEETDSRILMTGILPTLQYRHLQFDYMTPIKRYQTLSKTLFDIRGANFEIYLQGVDELIMSLGSVLFEACNTSFQLHLQINPSEFVDKHNWSQMIAGPVLSACANSPLLFGNELWAETRIALFKQSLDTRSSQKFLRSKLPRVYFGNKWLEKSPAELWKKDLTRFPLLVTSDDFQDAKEVLKNGGIPDLRAIRLHNGTTYTWNRLCYGPSKTNPHLRIECRYLPAGPSLADEMANFAFWIGLMNCEPPRGVKFWKKMDFRIAKNNFIKAARSGLDTVFHWFGKNIPAKTLLLEHLLPMAEAGLNARGVSSTDIDKYLGIFRHRVESESTGADWLVRNFRALSKRYGDRLAAREIVNESLNYQVENLPLYKWSDIDPNRRPLTPEEPTVESRMSKDVFSVNEEDSISLARSIMEWNNIHHLPVENNNGDLVGLITDGMIQRLGEEAFSEEGFAKTYMIQRPIALDCEDTITTAVEIMNQNNLSGLPVVLDKKLVGIFTKNDLEKIRKIKEARARNFQRNIVLK